MTKLTDADMKIVIEQIERVAGRRGYQRAIDALRDSERYDVWVAAQPFDEDLANDEPSRQQLAAYLESIESFNDPSREAGKETPC